MKTKKEFLNFLDKRLSILKNEDWNFVSCFVYSLYV